MPLSEAQAAQRQDKVGASEVAGLLGESPYVTPRRIFDRLVLGETPEPNEAMRLGVRFEPVIASVLKWRGYVVRSCHRSYTGVTIDGRDRLTAHPDLYVGPYGEHPRAVGEVKLSSHVSFAEIPRAWYWQIQAQTFLTKRAGGWLFQLNGSQLRTEWIEADPVAHSAIELAVRTFWRDYIDTGVRPEDPAFTFTHEPKPRKEPEND